MDLQEYQNIRNPLPSIADFRKNDSPLQEAEGIRAAIQAARGETPFTKLCATNSKSSDGIGGIIMPKKVILFLSDYKGNAQEQAYLSPDGSTVNGTQTNEAPVKYLL